MKKSGVALILERLQIAAASGQFQLARYLWQKQINFLLQNGFLIKSMINAENDAPKKCIISWETSIPSNEAINGRHSLNLAEELWLIASRKKTK